MGKPFTSYQVDDRSYVAYVKREIHSQLLESHFTKTRQAEIDIIVAEITSNLIKHANGGEVLSRLINTENESVYEIMTIDTGPGITDVQRMMKDGVSTTNTLGHGLGAIQRLSDDFHIYSLPKWGTVSFSTVQSKRNGINRIGGLDVKAICVPKKHESVCGDGYCVKRSTDYIHVFFADGLGHGEHAHEAVAKACEFFQSNTDENPVDIIRQMHNAVRKTRGLVGTLAVLDLKQRLWSICGVGNITTRLYGGMIFKHYMPYNGIIGLNIPNSLNPTVMPAEKNQQIIMSSDGLRSRWDLTKYPSILKSDSMLLAAALYKDFNRGNDDSSVLIGKVNFDK